MHHQQMPDATFVLGPEIVFTPSLPFTYKSGELYLTYLENKAKVKPDLRDSKFVPPQISLERERSLIAPHRPREDAKKTIDNQGIVPATSTLTIEESSEESPQISSPLDSNGTNRVLTQSTIDEDDPNDPVVLYFGKAPPNAISLSEGKRRALEEDDVLNLKRTKLLDGSSFSQTPARFRVDNTLGGIKVDNLRGDYSNNAKNRLHSLISARTNSPFNPLPPIEDPTTEKEEQVDADSLEKKQQLIAKFNMMRKMYPSAAIPYVSMSSDLGYLQEEYIRLITNLKMDEKFNSYKEYMVMMFYGMEFVCGHFLKMDVKGFAESQLSRMDKYDKLLLELGAKHALPNAPESIAVEWRLLGVVLVQFALFIMSTKGGIASVFSALGSKIGSFIKPKTSNQNQAAAQTRATDPPTQPILPQKLMRGPNN